MLRELRTVSARWFGLGLLAVVGLVAFAVAPVFGAEAPDADRLRLTSSTKAFYYGSVDPGSAATVQPVTVGNQGCEISPLTGALVTLSSNAGPGGIKGPGYVDFGVGVKSGGANGTPCAELDGQEKLTITSNNVWKSARLDVEVKGGVRVVAEFRGPSGLVSTHELLTGSSIAAYNAANNPDEVPAPGPIYRATTTATDAIAACADPNDSGPDANIKDNCLWSVDPGAPFTSITLYAKNGVGSVSLEGGADYASFDASGFAAGEYDSLFYRAISPKDDSYQTDEDTPLTVVAPGVLANDGTSGATVALNTGASSGSVNLDGNGGFTYTPNLNFNGTDSFTYLVNGGPAGATVNITVNPVNDDPELVSEITVFEDTETTFMPSELATDVDGDDLVIDSAMASEGMADIDGDGNLVYTPPDGFCGTDEITLTISVSDGNGGTVSVPPIEVNVACEADDDIYSMNARVEGVSGVVSATLTATAGGDPDGVLGNDGNATDFTKVTDPDEGVLNVQSDGSFDYTPQLRNEQQWAEELGNATSYDVEWTYQVSYPDQDPPNDVQTATVTITVNRNLCELDTVSDTDGDVSAAITMLSSTGCKGWVPVVADGDADTVLFEPNSDADAVYDGILTISGLEIEDGSLATVILKWDPTPGDESDGGYEPIPSCVDLDPDPDVVDPVLPGNPEEPFGWCFYDLDPELVGDQLWNVTWRVRGWDDPGFSFR